MNKVLMVQGILFLLTLLGFGLRKLNILKSESKGLLTDLVMSVFLPASIVNSFQMSFEKDILSTLVILLGVSTGVVALSYILGLLMFRKYKEEDRNVLRFGTLISNAGFIGLPVVESFYGSLGLMYGAMYLIPLRIALWTVGLSLFTKESNSLAGLKKVIRHPCMVAVYVGGFMLITGIRFFEPVQTTVVMLSKCTTPLIMIVIGSIIGEVKMLHTVFSWQVLRFSIIRTIILPMIVYVVILILPIDPVVGGISVILAAMPAGSTTAILAAKYHCNYELGTKIIILSTLMSLITIPIWGMIL